jgi:poly-gamma-glutamate synthesis protein (capsule biosynthesis protein)
MRKTAWALALIPLAAALALVWPMWPRPLPPPKPRVAPPPPPSVTISFVGDVMLASRVGALAAERGTEWVLAGVSKTLRGDDLTIANLECAVATCGARAAKKYTFRANPALLPGLRRAGIEAVSLANNHALDYGRAALVATFKHLHDADLAFAGAGDDLATAAQPVVLPAGRSRVALVAASRVLPSAGWRASANRPGIAPAYDPTRLLAEVRNVRGNADLVVAYLHWGVERAIRPERYQRALARQCIDAGADLVVGAHPHVLQGFEYYRGRLIAYSLGNFVFNNCTPTTAILRTMFEGATLKRAEVIPCAVLGYRPRVMGDAAARRRLLRSLEARSYGVRIADDGTLWGSGNPHRQEQGNHKGTKTPSNAAQQPALFPVDRAFVVYPLLSRSERYKATTRFCSLAARMASRMRVSSRASAGLTAYSRSPRSAWAISA